MKEIRTLLIATVLLVAVFAVQAAEVRGEVEEESDGWVETIDEVIDVAAGGTLLLDVDRGGIEVVSEDRKSVRVIIEKTADVFTESEARRVLQDYKVDITRNGNDVSVTAESQSDRRTRALYVSVRVVVPSRYSIDVRTGSGGIEVGRIRNGSVEVYTSGGGIEIESIENGDGQVETFGGGIEVGDVTGNLTVHTSGGGIDIGDVGGALVAETSGGGIRIGEVGGTVLAETGGGSIRVSGSGGSVEVKTSGGGIRIKNAKGPVRAKTSGGSITIENAGADVVAKTSGGGIRVQGSGGPVDVRTSGGSITLWDIQGAIKARTSGGDITAELVVADSKVDTRCTLESAGGDITIRLPGKLKADIDAELRLERPRTRYRITSDFPLDIDDGSRRITAQGKLNGGGDLITLRTTNGDIEIQKR
jgi:DUF4097 and DUF4098 domain-containing protein YvlB